MLKLMMISAVYAQIMMIVYETILMMMRLRSKGMLVLSDIIIFPDSTS